MALDHTTRHADIARVHSAYPPVMQGGISLYSRIFVPEEKGIPHYHIV